MTPACMERNLTPGGSPLSLLACSCLRLHCLSHVVIIEMIGFLFIPQLHLIHSCNGNICSEVAHSGTLFIIRKCPLVVSRSVIPSAIHVGEHVGCISSNSALHWVEYIGVLQNQLSKIACFYIRDWQPTEAAVVAVCNALESEHTSCVYTKCTIPEFHCLIAISGHTQPIKVQQSQIHQRAHMVRILVQNASVALSSQSVFLEGNMIDLSKLELFLLLNLVQIHELHIISCRSLVFLSRTKLACQPEQ
mmetsp:Transcript_5450/g.20359  ORF Transcript_5450/g.20359 Transcript_5450/m.20359 type:complete len:248 (-) Transcript_5450:1220-1963(-)